MHFIPDLISFINQRKWVENNLAEEQCIRLICFQLAALALLHCGCFSWRVTGCDNDELWGISTRQSVTQVLILRPRLIYQNKIRRKKKKKREICWSCSSFAAALLCLCCRWRRTGRPFTIIYFYYLIKHNNKHKRDDKTTTTQTSKRQPFRVCTFKRHLFKVAATKIKKPEKMTNKKSVGCFFFSPHLRCRSVMNRCWRMRRSDPFYYSHIFLFLDGLTGGWRLE